MSGLIPPGRPRPRPSQGLLALILPLSFVFILLPPPPVLADPFVDTDVNTEVGGSRRVREREEPPPAPVALGLELSVQAGYTAFSEKDLSDTYGGMPQIGIEASIGTDETARFLLGLRYGRVTGDPFYDTPDFDGEGSARLQAWPLTLGFKIHNDANPRYRLYWGALVEFAWTEEKIPSFDALSDHRIERGWTKGLLFMVAPEWRSCDQRRAVGLTFLYGGSSGKIGKGYDSYEINAIGTSARLHYTVSL